MSFKAMAWAVEQEITNTSPQSHLLLILASFANEFNVCYPSIATMMKKTRLAEKTVKKALKELTELKLISDTKNVSNFNTKVYQLHLEVGINGGSNFAGGADLQGGKSTPTPPVNLPQGGCKFTAEPPVNLPPNPVNNPINNPINEPVSYDAHTHTHASENFQTQKNPNSEQTPSADNRILEKTKTTTAKKQSVKDYLISLGVDNQIADDFIYFRQEIKKPLTITAINRLVTETNKTDLDINSAIEFTLDMGWQSFTAEYYFNRQQNHPVNSNPNQPRTFDEQGNIYATHQPNYQKNHQPHPNSTTAYAQRLEREVKELKRDLYGH